MAEIVPGLFVSPYVSKGVMYEFRRGFLPGSEGGAIAISTTTWEALSPAQQEEVRDIFVRRCAREGQMKLEFFVGQSNQGGQRG